MWSLGRILPMWLGRYILNSIREVYVNFDMSTVTDNVDKDIMLPVVLPSGVSASDVTVVNVRVTLTTVETDILEDVPLNLHNNYNNLAISSINLMSVNVELSGSANNIAAVRVDDVEVYFDMPSEPGTYTLPLHVVSSTHPYVSMTLEKSNVNVTVVEANQ